MRDCAHSSVWSYSSYSLIWGDPLGPRQAGTGAHRHRRSRTPTAPRAIQHPRTHRHRGTAAPPSPSTRTHARSDTGPHGTRNTAYLARKRRGSGERPSLIFDASPRTREKRERPGARCYMGDSHRAADIDKSFARRHSRPRVRYALLCMRQVWHSRSRSCRAWGQHSGCGAAPQQERARVTRRRSSDLHGHTRHRKRWMGASAACVSRALRSAP